MKYPLMPKATAIWLVENALSLNKLQSFVVCMNWKYKE